MDPRTTIATEGVTERHRVIRSALATMKNLADAAEGATTPKAVVERIVARNLAVGLRLFKPEPVKAASESAQDPIVLAAIAERKLGPGFVDYEPETLQEALGIDADEATRLMLVVFALYDPAPYLDWHVFAHLACALNEREVVFDTPPDLSVAELAWAADALRYLDPLTPWGDEVAVFVAAHLHGEGFTRAPEALAFARDPLARLHRGDAEAAGAPAIQRARMETVDAYVTARHARLLAQMTALKAGMV